MKLLWAAAAFLQACSHVDAKAVFAHFMLTNTGEWGIADWEADIKLAQAAHIDAFVLNFAYKEDTTIPQLSNAFTAANNLDFKMLFSFDYAGNGAWPQSDVTDLIKEYGPNWAYFKHSNGKPLVSTFEGPDSANDWVSIKASTDIFFVPDWSSKGASAALGLAGGVADGLFSWGAWPAGPSDKNTNEDDSYIAALGGKPFMMPASPWFYTNLPGWSKNWIWRGDDLWFDRWQQILDLAPEYVQIISWNDYGESHYIGPLHENGFGAIEYGGAPFNYVRDMPHDGWRAFLPYVIDSFKSGKPAVSKEGLVGWYRLSPATACGTGGTTGNTVSQGQTEYPPSQIAQDKVFFSALLSSSATVTVSIGGSAAAVQWENTPAGGAGLYHGSVAFGGRTGEVKITVARGGNTVSQLTGKAISTDCSANGGLTNWNAWVGSA